MLSDYLKKVWLFALQLRKVDLGRLGENIVRLIAYIV